VQDLLRVENLRIVFDLPEGKLEAVRDVSFRVPAGRTVAVVGESGSGKSVITQAILGILPKAARVAGGSILFADPQQPDDPPVDIATLAPRSTTMRRLRGGRISIIFQEPMTSLSPVHMVGDQIGEALRLHSGTSGRANRELVAEMLARVGFPDPKRALRTYPFELSGGLRQRAMIAMALVCRPALLIADEPTTALDVTIQAQILKLLQDLQAEFRMSVMLITHDLGVVANLAEEVTVMYRGEVMESGPVEAIFGDPQHPYLKGLLQAVPRVDMPDGERLKPLREIKHSSSSALMEKLEPWPEGADVAGPLLKVEHLSKTFRLRSGGMLNTGPVREVLAVDDVSFEVRRGECLGLVGESGCGKTTVSKIIMRALTPDTGSVTFNDRGKAVDVLALEGEELTRFRRKMQFVFQDPFGSLSPRMTVYEILSEPLLIHGIGDEDSRRQLVRELLELVGLDVRHLRRYPHSFSGGQRQRIGIARALALRPELLICDEPVSALDVSVQAQVLNLLQDLRSSLGLTYLFISHNLAVVDYIANRIAVMCRGRLVEFAPNHLIFSNPVHPYTRALLAAVPEPDLHHKLDLTALMEGRASIPSAWPAPFTVDEGQRPRMVEVEPEHWVRASGELLSAGADIRVPLEA